MFVYIIVVKYSSIQRMNAHEQKSLVVDYKSYHEDMVQFINVYYK